MFIFAECNEYHDALSESRWIPDDSGQNQIEVKVTQCPVSIISYIVDGENAVGKEFPHMVSSTLGRTLSFFLKNTLYSLSLRP